MLNQEISNEVIYNSISLDSLGFRFLVKRSSFLAFGYSIIKRTMRVDTLAAWLGLLDEFIEIIQISFACFELIYITDISKVIRSIKVRSSVTEIDLYGMR
jgi:hypothetical protein